MHVASILLTGCYWMLLVAFETNCVEAVVHAQTFHEGPRHKKSQRTGVNWYSIHGLSVVFVDSWSPPMPSLGRVICSGPEDTILGSLGSIVTDMSASLHNLHHGLKTCKMLWCVAIDCHTHVVFLKHMHMVLNFCLSSSVFCLPSSMYYALCNPGLCGYLVPGKPTQMCTPDSSSPCRLVCGEIANAC